MIKWVKDITIIATAAMMLSACSSSSDENQAAQLPVFEASYHPHVAWTQSVGNGIGDYFSQLRPAVDEKAVYVAARNGVVKAFSINNGKLLWKANLNTDASSVLNISPRISGGVGLGDNTLFIGTENAEVFALDASNGNVKWTSTVSGEVLAQPVYDNKLVVIHTSRGDLIALNSDNGEQVWNLSNSQPKLTLRGNATPTIAQGGIVYGRSDGYVAVALLMTGQQGWQLPIARPYGATELERLVDVDMTPVVLNNVVYALAYNGNLVAIELLTGREIWSQKYSGFSNLTVSGQDIFLTDYRGYIFSVDRDDGQQRWVNKELAYRNVTGVTVANEYIVVGDEEGYLHWLDRFTGKFVAQQDLDEGGLYKEPIATATHLYLQTRNGELISIEKPILNVE